MQILSEKIATARPASATLCSTPSSGRRGVTPAVTLLKMRARLKIPEQNRLQRRELEWEALCGTPDL